MSLGCNAGVPTLGAGGALAGLSSCCCKSVSTSPALFSTFDSLVVLRSAVIFSDSVAL